MGKHLFYSIHNHLTWEDDGYSLYNMALEANAVDNNWIVVDNDGSVFSCGDRPIYMAKTNTWQMRSPEQYRRPFSESIEHLKGKDVSNCIFNVPEILNKLKSTHDNTVVYSPANNSSIDSS